MAGKSGATRGIAASVLKFFLENPSAHVQVSNLVTEFGVSEGQAANAVSYLIRQNKLPGLKAIQNGHVWMYDPEGDDGEAKMTVIGHASNDGLVVLQDVNGDLWAAKKVRF